MSFVLLFLGGVDIGRIKRNNYLPPQAQAIFARLGINPQQLHPDPQKRVTQLTDTNKSKPTRKLEASPQTQPQLEPWEPIPPHPPGHQPQLCNLRAPTQPPPFEPPSPTPTLVSRPQPHFEPREPIPPHPPGCQPQLGNSRAPTPPPPFVPPSPPPTLVSRPQSPSTSVPGKFYNVKNIRGKRIFFGFQKGHFC